MALNNNILKIMIHTDTHLGYMERDAHRGSDSFATFEEALYNAKRLKCDMVIHAGDMFHENKPSRQTMHSAMALFRKYCLGDDGVYFDIDLANNGEARDRPEFADVFKANGGKPNFLSPHHAISLPYFAIHGNHDDPSREGTSGDALSALDMLSMANFITYFGKSERVDKFVIQPIIIEKKDCKIALYGLGAIRDERLHRMFSENKVEFVSPGGGPSEYFNILVVHQNRDKGRGKNCLREGSIPNWMSLVIWGNEHECIPFAQCSSAEGNLHILQPGSSIATSLIYSESHEIQKKYAILEIKEDKHFRIKQHNYLQIRPFVFDYVNLKEHLDPRDSKVEEKLKTFLSHRIKNMIENAREHSSIVEESYPGVQLTHRISDPSLVLIRLKVESDGFTNLHVQRFGQKFVGNVANPSDLLIFSKQKRERSAFASVKPTGKKKQDDDMSGEGDEDSEEETEAVRKIKIEEFVEEQMRSNRSLSLLPSSNMQSAIEDYVYRKNTSAIQEQVSGILRKFQSSMIRDKSVGIDRDPVSNQEVLRDVAAKLRKAEEAATNAAKGKEKPRNYVAAFSDDEQELNPSPTTAPKGRAKKASATTKATAKTKVATANKRKVATKETSTRRRRGVLVDDSDDATVSSAATREDIEIEDFKDDDYNDDDDDDDDDDDEEEEERPKRGRPKKAAAAPKIASSRRTGKTAPSKTRTDSRENQLELTAPASTTAPVLSRGGERKRARPSFMS